jgi:FG-GAP-like repeat/FG-GAP repeat
MRDGEKGSTWRTGRSNHAASFALPCVILTKPTKAYMKKGRNNSQRASTLWITLSTGLISISAVLLALAAPAKTENASRRDLNGFQLKERAAADFVTALGNYPDTSILLSTDTTVTPDAAPTNTTSINVSTNSNFNGTFAASPTTGVVTVTDAHPAGTYMVTVSAFNGGDQTATKTFALTVTTPTTCLPVSFAAAINFDTPIFPVFVAVGDFNGDGQQDLAVANFGVGPPHPQPGSVYILLGNGAGSFTAATNFGAGQFFHPQSVAVRDFNNDGKQDLAVTNTDAVWILLGDGAGHFSSATNFGAGSLPQSVAVGDFNGDGKQDLAVANYASNNVSILLGDGAGSFNAPTNFGAGTGPGSVAVGDFNGDGKQDLATANDGSDNVSILLGDGTGSFTAASNFGAGPHPSSVAVGDFNGDGKQDLAVANQSGNNVSILLGNGAGSFTAAANFGAGSNPSSVAVGDFNGDGKQDLAVADADPSSGTVSILLGDGAGSFGAPINFGAGSFPISVAVGDFNGDGKQDLAVANPSSGNVSILLRDCGPTPTPTPTATPTATATSTPSPTPTPALVSISGTVSYCSNPALPPVPNVTLTLTGASLGSTLSNGSGFYMFSSLPSGGTYTVTPTKAALTPGSAGINTVDVIAIQRQFLGLGTLLSGCRLTAADVNGDTSIDTIDVVAVQRFFLSLSTGIAKTGKYQFNPVNRTYPGMITNQIGQNYDALVFGDVASPFASP